MSDNQTIKNYTAADIEKYWNKKLSPAEMHEMEKAAMDDPFFADALEGYKNSINPADELSALRNRFEEKRNDVTPAVSLHSKKYQWLKIAAAIIVLVGAGLWIQQLVPGTKKENSISKTETPVVKPEHKKANEGGDIVLQANPDTAIAGSTTTERQGSKQTETEVAIKDLNSSYARSTAHDSLATFGLVTSDDKDRKTDTLQAAVASVQQPPIEKKDIADEKKKAEGEITAVSKPGYKRDAETANQRAFSYDYYSKESGLLNNRFNYRVVDAQNNPVPFANVMNTRDNVGTYTDVRGYFNLVSSDSILDVQVRSLGYNSENYKLVPSQQPNDLVLKEDATARNQLLNDQRSGRVMSNVSRKDSAEVEEPEVGWGNYNTYVENNIKIPGNVRAKNALNEVELSFDVDKTGQPINIKVTKSSQCKECDEEAKRLLKEGPKWKRKGKKYKTTISIAVDQN